MRPDQLHSLGAKPEWSSPPPLVVSWSAILLNTETMVSIKAHSNQKVVGTISKQRKLFRLAQNSQDMEENKK